MHVHVLENRLLHRCHSSRLLLVPDVCAMNFNLVLSRLLNSLRIICIFTKEQIQVINLFKEKRAEDVFKQLKNNNNNNHAYIKHAENIAVR